MDSQERDYWFALLKLNLQDDHAPQEALVKATIDTATLFDIGPQRCEHGIIDGNWCEPCNLEYKAAKKDKANL